jgi:hypothetical protein
MDIGFRIKQVYSWQIDTDREFKSPQARNNYYRELKQRITLINGIESVSLSDTVPFGYKRHWHLDAQGVSYHKRETIEVTTYDSLTTNASRR